MLFPFLGNTNPQAQLKKGANNMTVEKTETEQDTGKNTKPKAKPYKVTYSETFVDTAPMGEWRNHPKD